MDLKRMTGRTSDGTKEVRRERRWQKLYAATHGYFWLPCPLCDEYFGGHERGSGMVPTDDPTRFQTICPACTAERQERAEELLREYDIGGSRYGTRWGSAEAIGHKIGADF